MKLARFIKYIAVLRTIIAVVIGITLAVCIIYLVSSEPSSTVKNFFIGPLLNFSRIGNIFESATPLILAGVGTAVAFQAGMIYIGAGGALFLGAAVGTLVAVSTNAPTFIHLLIALLAAMVTGAFVGYIPGYLRAKIGIHEFITSLMLNYIAAFLGIYIINYFARDTAAALLQSKELPITAWFPRIVPGTRIHVGFILAILMAFLINFFLYNTHWGYEIRMVGKNQEFAKFNGINIERTIVISTSIAGAMAGFAGMSEVMGIFHRFQWSETPGWGFESILIVILARNNPILIIPVALFFAYLKTGAQNAAVLGDIPSEIVVIIISMVIFLATAELFFKNLKQRLSMEKINKDELHY
jgi:general nucleoside transport system permease protein